MKLTYLGHSSFLLEYDDKTKILTDPFDETVGYDVYDGTCDIVTISHHHFDHDCINFIKGDFKVIDEPGDYNIKGFKIKGLPSFHDKAQGQKRGNNTIFIIEKEGYRICHMGDLGHTIDSNMAEEIGKIDVLLIPIGGNYTICGKEACEIAKLINSTYVIPMHYKTTHTNLKISGTEEFITCMKNGERLHSNTFEPEKSETIKNKVIIL